MLKALLVERFGLRARHETRQAPVHTLTVARSDGRLGPGLQRASRECEQQLAKPPSGRQGSPATFVLDLSAPPPCGSMRPSLTVPLFLVEAAPPLSLLHAESIGATAPAAPSDASSRSACRRSSWVTANSSPNSDPMITHRDLAV